MAGIYKITNKINNKLYIGQTHNTIEKRWKEHIQVSNRYKKTNLDDKYAFAIHKAIAKYGVENFDFDIIYERIYHFKINYSLRNATKIPKINK